MSGSLFQFRAQQDVAEFHRALDIPIGQAAAIRRPELRASLIEEEAAETCAAIRAGDLVEAVDGFCDLLCVVYGAAVEFGIDLAPFWREVHKTNMAKVGGPVREDGKRLKPEGWKPPQIADLLRTLCDCGHHHVSGEDGEDCGCRDCDCMTWAPAVPGLQVGESIGA